MLDISLLLDILLEGYQRVYLAPYIIEWIDWIFH